MHDLPVCLDGEDGDRKPSSIRCAGQRMEKARIIRIETDFVQPPTGQLGRMKQSDHEVLGMRHELLIAARDVGEEHNDREFVFIERIS